MPGLIRDSKSSTSLISVEKIFSSYDSSTLKWGWIIRGPALNLGALSLCGWAFTGILTRIIPKNMMILPKIKPLVRQAKLVRFSWLRSQPDKVNRPSEPSFASIRVIVWVKRKQGSSRP